MFLGTAKAGGRAGSQGHNSVRDEVSQLVTSRTQAQGNVWSGPCTGKPGGEEVLSSYGEETGQTRGNRQPDLSQLFRQHGKGEGVLPHHCT